MKRFTIFYIGFWLLFLFDSYSQASEKPSYYDTLVIPEFVSNYLRSHLVDMQLVDLNNFMGYWKEYYYGDKNCPNYCIADFNGDKKLDYAFLMRDTFGDVFLYALFCKEDECDNNNLVESFLYTNISSGKKLNFGLKNIIDSTGKEGIYVYHFEKPSKQYFWDSDTNDPHWYSRLVGD